jgi:hypothetical protein
MQLRRVLALCVAAIVFAAAPSVLAQRNNQPQQQKRPKTEQMDIDALSSAVDFAAAGKSPTDIGLTWEMNHFMRAADRGTVLAFIVDVDKSALASPDAMLYIRVMDKAQTAAAAAAASAPADKKDPKTVVAPNYVWQNLYTITVPADGRLQRAIALPPGEYEQFAALKEKTRDEKKPVTKVGVVHKTLTVPDYTAGFALSDVIVAKAIDQLPAPLTPAQALENPYVFGPLRLTPTTDGKFMKSGELGFLFWVYNAGNASTGKPDVTIEYNFYLKTGGTEKAVTRLATEALNASTLPPEWDPAKGHQLTQLQQVPLQTFTPGDYRLEIKVTDKTNGKTITQNINFNVA